MIFNVQSSSKIAYGSFIVIKMCMGMEHTITSGERKNGDEGRYIYDILHFKKKDQMQINQHIINLNLRGVYIFSVYLHNLFWTPMAYHITFVVLFKLCHFNLLSCIIICQGTSICVYETLHLLMSNPGYLTTSHKAGGDQWTVFSWMIEILSSFAIHCFLSEFVWST